MKFLYLFIAFSLCSCQVLKNRLPSNSTQANITHLPSEQMELLGLIKSDPKAAEELSRKMSLNNKEKTRGVHPLSKVIKLSDFPPVEEWSMETRSVIITVIPEDPEINRALMKFLNAQTNQWIKSNIILALARFTNVSFHSVKIENVQEINALLLNLMQNDSDPEIRSSAAFHIGESESLDENAVDVLFKVLANTDEVVEVRSNSMHSLLRLKYSSEKYMERLIATLKGMLLTESSAKLLYKSSMSLLERKVVDDKVVNTLFDVYLSKPNAGVHTVLGISNDILDSTYPREKYQKRLKPIVAKFLQTVENEIILRQINQTLSRMN